MNELRALADRLRAVGVPDSAILEAVLALEDARSDKLEQRRTADRERQRRFRGGPAPPSNVMSRDPETTGTTPPSGFPSPTPPSFPKPPSLSSSAGAREDFRREARDRSAEILAICKARVNGAFAASPSAIDISPIINLIAPETGQPCDFEADVLPAIDFKAEQARKTGKPIKSWSWIGERAIENRDRRLAGLPAVAAVQPKGHAKGSDRSSDLDRMLAKGRTNGRA